jgi:DNA-binding NarL/FixJ family response regulator
MSSIRTLIADDHTIVRAGVRSLLEKLPDVVVVGEASDGREVLTMMKERQPNLVLMDIAMPNLNGIETASRIVKEFPHVKVILLSMHANEEYVARALRAGASGYLLKNAATSELEVAVHAVARGETYLSPAISKHVISTYLGRDAQEHEPRVPLTARQREILQLIAEGKSTKEIAALLNLGTKTVETHRTQLMKRLDIHDVSGLVRYAMRIGVISVEQ